GLYNLGAILTARRQYDDALAVLLRAAEMDSASADTHYLCAHVASLVDRWELAREHADHARRLAPNDAKVLRLWSKSLLNTGALGQAIAATEHATDRSARLRLAYLYQAAGRIEEARQIFGEFGETAQTVPSGGAFLPPSP